MKIYTLKPQFITNLQERFRKFKLGLYKRKKINKSKTPYQRYYHMKFKIHVVDDFNPQSSTLDYEMIIPARAAFFAKANLEKSVKEKIAIEVIDWDEIADEEYEEYLKTREEFIEEENKSIKD